MYPLCDNVCHWLAGCRWFSPGTPIFSTNKTYPHYICNIVESGVLHHNANALLFVSTFIYTCLFLVLPQSTNIVWWNWLMPICITFVEGVKIVPMHWLFMVNATAEPHSHCHITYWLFQCLFSKSIKQLN